MRQSSSKKKTNDQRIIPPLDPRALVHLICILTQFENTLFQTFKPGVATLVNSNGTEKKKKKKKYAKNRKWWRSWDKLNVAFLHWRCCLQKFFERRCDLRLAHVRQTLQLARSLCWRASLSLSLSCTANCSQSCTKEWPPLFLTDFSNSFLIDVIHAPRIYPIPDVSLRSDQRLTPLL